MSNYFTKTLRGLALLSLVLGMAAALLASPGSAAAATCNPIGMGPRSCTAIGVTVYDKMNGSPVDNAKVSLIDAYGNVTRAYEIGDVAGRYAANVTPGNYRVIVTAPTFFSYSTKLVVKTQPVSTSAPLTPSTYN